MVISSEEAIAKGIRRIVALSGPEAERALHRGQRRPLTTLLEKKDEIREQGKAAQRTLDGYKKQADAAIAEKALDNALKQLKSTKAVMGFSVNEDSGKVLVLAKSLVDGGLKANLWVNEVCTVLGGRGGGKRRVMSGNL
ncbi:hypothetical protein COOONC_20695 [Cooperia oncophora]